METKQGDFVADDRSIAKKYPKIRKISTKGYQGTIISPNPNALVNRILRVRDVLLQPGGASSGNKCESNLIKPIENIQKIYPHEHIRANMCKHTALNII